MTADITWTPVTVRLSQLTPWERNPKRISKTHASRLLDLWQRLGQFQTIAIGPSGEVYDGHQRLSVLKAKHGAGYEVQALQSSRSLTEAEREELTVAAHVGTVGQFDWDALSGWDADNLQQWGFDNETLANWQTDIGALSAMLASEEEPPPEDPGAQIDKAEELREKWGVEAGQLWALGEHRLICGDCTDGATVERVMGGEKAGMVFADPPYGVNIVAANGYVGGGEGPGGMIPFGGVKGSKRLGSPNGAKPFGTDAVRGSDGASNIVAVGKYAPVIGDETTDTAIKAVTMFLAKWPDAIHVWWGGNYYVEALGSSSCWLVWNKETTGNFADCELAWTNQERAAKLFTHKWNGMLRDSERERRWHPTQKPAALAVWVFETLGGAGDVVFDPFCGAGMSVIAGEQSGRVVRAVEMSVDYIAVAIERFYIMTGIEPVLLETNRNDQPEPVA